MSTTLLRSSLLAYPSKVSVLSRTTRFASTLPNIVKPSHSERDSGKLGPRNLEFAVRSLHEDGLVVVSDVIPHEHLNHLNAKMVGDARLLQARGKDGPFNYNVGNIVSCIKCQSRSWNFLHADC